MTYAGIDAGSTATKAILIDSDERIVARALVATGADVRRAAERAFASALDGAKLRADDVEGMLCTGYGRYRAALGDDVVSEIACHALGAHRLFPDTRTVVDIGGQDTKAIAVGPAGEVVDFCMNDRCAAGTGSFLEAAAEALGLALEVLGVEAARADRARIVSSDCTVFVEQEVLGHIAAGVPLPEVAAGLCYAVTRRAVGLARRVGVRPEVTFTGGVAANAGAVKALREGLDLPIRVCDESAFAGALGAALLARQNLRAATPAPARGVQR